MRPFFENIADVIPFDIDDLIDLDDLPLDFDIKEDNYVRKNSYEPTILNQEFVQWLKDNLNLTVNKVILWHWKTDNNPNIAHIDSNPAGQISPGAAINWTLSKNISSVAWFKKENIEYKVSMNNEADRRWSTPNVEAYIAVPVKFSDRLDEWSDRGPALIETSIPHLIYAGDRTRVSVSLNCGDWIDFDEVITKVDKIREKNSVS
jgi:hypothetical protein